MKNVKVCINGKRKYSWFGLYWKVDKRLNTIVLGPWVKKGSSITITYDYKPETCPTNMLIDSFGKDYLY